MFNKKMIALLSAGALVFAAGLVPAMTPAADAAPSEQAVLRVEMGDYYFAPQVLNAAAGTITFQLVNAGQKRHNLAIIGNGASAGSSDVEAGANGGFTAQLGPGTYTLVCEVGDHIDRGMVGTLVVTGGAEPAPAEAASAEPAPAEGGVAASSVEGGE